MITSFKCADTKRFFEGESPRRFPSEIRDRARLRLAQLNAAATLDFMRIPPSNRLEALKGDRKGQYSVRVNQQWRICFRWSAAGAQDVEMIDYH
jgi:toxin HigB-1